MALLGLALVAPGPALAAEADLSLAFEPGRLADALQEISSRARKGVLFSPQVIGERRSRPLAGAMTLEEALDRLLAGEGLAWRRTSSGAYIIYAAPTAERPVALPELLVVGRRSQNADIRRTENDIQPYHVFGARELRAAQSDNVDQFLRTNLTGAASLEGPSTDPTAEFGSNRSEVNLQGLGPNQTLVLVDGARMPGIPYLDALKMRQPDLNGVPLLAIDRIETLTATAGGIYGPGATGGVVNLVLRRDYRGADLALTYGVTARGDAPRRRVDGRIGFSPDHGRTDVMLAFSLSRAAGLGAGARSYAVRAREILIAKDPVAFLNGFRTADAILVTSSVDAPLKLSPALGGASLGSSFTYLPIGRDGATGDLASVLVANAGKVPSALAEDGTGADHSLMGDRRVTSILFNVRHDFGDHVEAFVDALGYQNNGHANIGQQLPNSLPIQGPDSPFEQPVLLRYPTPGLESLGRSRLRTYRVTTGLIARLPFSWKADASIALGAVRSALSSRGVGLDLYGVLTGTVSTPNPPVDPFGDWGRFSQALRSHIYPIGFDFITNARFGDASLRLAGPLWSTKAGPVNLTLLAERRSEVVPTYSQTLNYSGQPTTSTSPGFTQVVSSLYGELRAPIFDRRSAPRLVRGLELQMALRYDDNRATVPDRNEATVRADQTAMAYMAGLRAYPTRNLMVRGSVSTGILPPNAAQIVPAISSSFGGFPSAFDPKRGGAGIGAEAPYTLLYRGSANVEPERARTISLGVVLNPEGGGRPRVSIDYTQVAKTNEIIENFSGSVRYFLANEALYPDRVVRAPLTDADRAEGFTGGVVTQIDASFLNVGRTRSDVVDVKADYGVWVGDLGRLQLYGAATWQPRLTRRISPDRPKEDYVGYADGPVRWRGSIGLLLERGPLFVNATGQIFGKYTSVAHLGTILPSSLAEAALRGPGVSIPAQAYLDASLGYAFQPRGGPVKTLEARIGVQNLLDHRPPTVINTDLGYSFYGDPRRRRFEVSLRARY